MRTVFTLFTILCLLTASASTAEGAILCRVVVAEKSRSAPLLTVRELDKLAQDLQTNFGKVKRFDLEDGLTTLLTVEVADDVDPTPGLLAIANGLEQKEKALKRLPNLYGIDWKRELLWDLNSRTQAVLAPVAFGLLWMFAIPIRELYLPFAISWGALTVLARTIRMARERSYYLQPRVRFTENLFTRINEQEKMAEDHASLAEGTRAPIILLHGQNDRIKSQWLGFSELPPEIKTLVIRGEEEERNLIPNP